MPKPPIRTVRVNIYLRGGEWCYSLWIDGQSDHSDTIGCDDSEDWDGAEQSIRAQLPQFPRAEIRLVSSQP